MVRMYSSINMIAAWAVLWSSFSKVAVYKQIEVRTLSSEMLGKGNFLILILFQSAY